MRSRCGCLAALEPVSRAERVYTGRSCITFGHFPDIWTFFPRPDRPWTLPLPAVGHHGQVGGEVERDHPRARLRGRALVT
eukprot:4386156-Pyramimonas_sp.AAC.1